MVAPDSPAATKAPVFVRLSPVMVPSAVPAAARPAAALPLAAFAALRAVMEADVAADGPARPLGVGPSAPPTATFRAKGVPVPVVVAAGPNNAVVAAAEIAWLFWSVNVKPP